MINSLIAFLLINLHPFFVSVIDMNHNAKEKSLEISVRIFTEDLEETLKQNFPREKIDLYHVVSRDKTDSLISRYIRQKLVLSTEKSRLTLNYVGFEKINESIWCYFEVLNLPVLKQIHISDKLLYDFKPEQINMHHLTVGGKRQSRKMDNPESELDFVF